MCNNTQDTHHNFINNKCNDLFWLCLLKAEILNDQSEDREDRKIIKITNEFKA